MTDMEDNWMAVVAADELSPGEIKGARIGDIDIAVYNLDGSYYATDNICSHAHAFLSDGFVDGDWVECPLHAGAFEIKTGKAVCSPAVDDIRTFATRVVGNEVQVRVNS